MFAFLIPSRTKCAVFTSILVIDVPNHFVNEVWCVMIIGLYSTTESVWTAELFDTISHWPLPFIFRQNHLSSQVIGALLWGPVRLDWLTLGCHLHSFHFEFPFLQDNE